jgi:hypothetical protein
MPPWFGSDLLLIGKGVVGALAFFAYTTITGVGGFCLVFSITRVFSRQWLQGCIYALFSFAVAAGIATLMIIAIRATNELGGQIASGFLALPYILGFFGRFFVPGESESE